MTCPCVVVVTALVAVNVFVAGLLLAPNAERTSFSFAD
jgi:hypothetical protein